MNVAADIFLIIGLVAIIIMALQWAHYHDRQSVRKAVAMPTGRTNGNHRHRAKNKGSKFYRKLSRKLGGWYYRLSLLKEHGHG